MSNLINISNEIVQAEIRGFKQATQFNNEVILAIYIAVMLTVVAIVIWIYFWQDSKKTKFLRFYNEGEATLIAGNIDNQLFQKKNKAWHINKTKPIILHTFLGKRPLYLIKDDTAIPFKFDKSRKIKLSSESLKNFCDHDNIRQLMKLSTSDNKDKLIFMVIGLVAGVIAGIIAGGFI